MKTVSWVQSNASRDLFTVICRRLLLTDRHVVRINGVENELDERGYTWLGQHIPHVLGIVLLCLFVFIGVNVKACLYEAGFVPVTKANYRDSTFQRIQSDQG